MRNSHYKCIDEPACGAGTGTSAGTWTGGSDSDSDIDSDSYEDTDDESVDPDEYDHIKSISSDYIGLKSLADLLGYAANRITKTRDIDRAIQLYLDSIAIDPHNQYISNLAILYETRLKNNELAINYYKMAIENDDVHAMYNLADLYKNCKELPLMFKYYEMAALANDFESVKQLVKYYFKDNSIELFSKHFFHYLIQTSDQDDYPYEEYNLEFEHFLQNNTSLSMIMLLETFIDSSHDTTTHHAVILLDKLRKLPQYSVYKNKISLFTRLNCNEECKICYDTKLNIDLHCGHTVCTDCYTKLYNKDCPFCRISPNDFDLVIINP
jgi:tetratricopeptide (TPR) repeat protein